jgi:hypothetical protein
VKDPIYHPKYIPSSRTRWVNNEPTPNPFNPLYNGRPRFVADSNNRISLAVFMVLASLLVANYIKLVRQQQFQLKENEPFVYKKPKFRDTWLSDTLNRDVTLVPYEVLEKAIWVSPQLQNGNNPKDYNIAYRPTRPPMPYDLATVQQSARDYAASIPKEMSLVTSKSIKTSSVLGANMVFAGSFDSRDNAESILAYLKRMGYDHAEIIMKDKLPYLIVVTGFNYRENTATNIVKALEKKGISAYATDVNWKEIYRNRGH